VFVPLWLIAALGLVLLVSVLPPLGPRPDRPARRERSGWPEPGTRRGAGRRIDIEWLMHLKAACDAGYYKADTDEPLAPIPPDVACRDCYFWVDNFCRLTSRDRDPEGESCAFFYGLDRPETQPRSDEVSDASCLTE
jgi:hypothetical protein